MNWKVLFMFVLVFCGAGLVVAVIENGSFSEMFKAFSYVNKEEKAIRVLKKICLSEGSGSRFCNCMEAELLDIGLNESDIDAILDGYLPSHPKFNISIMGARLRCMCNVYPEKVEMYGFSCD